MDEFTVRVDRSRDPITAVITGELDMSATMLYGVLDCDTGTFRYSGAGHLPPLLITVDGEATYLEGGRNVPLGGFVTRPRETASAHVSVQDWLVLYSDGLVERRGESLDVGLDRLMRFGKSGRLHDAPGLCNHVVSRLLANVTQRDDIAVLAVRPIPAEIRLRRPAEPAMPGTAPAPAPRAGRRRAVRHRRIRQVAWRGRYGQRIAARQSRPAPLDRARGTRMARRWTPAPLIARCSRC